VLESRMRKQKCRGATCQQPLQCHMLALRVAAWQQQRQRDCCGHDSAIGLLLFLCFMGWGVEPGPHQLSSGALECATTLRLLRTGGPSVPPLCVLCCSVLLTLCVSVCANAGCLCYQSTPGKDP
jgi:hypothetical protein